MGPSRTSVTPACPAHTQADWGRSKVSIFASVSDLAQESGREDSAA